MSLPPGAQRAASEVSNKIAGLLAGGNGHKQDRCYRNVSLSAELQMDFPKGALPSALRLAHGNSANLWPTHTHGLGPPSAGIARPKSQSQ